MAKIFVSGQYEDIVNVQAIQNQVIELGHTITRDWTVAGESPMLIGREAKLANPAEAAKRAQKDVQGIVDCDIYILPTDNQVGGRGMYTELGVALGLNVTQGKPDVYIVGQRNFLSLFYLHPAVMHVPTIEELIETIRQKYQDS